MTGHVDAKSDAPPLASLSALVLTSASSWAIWSSTRSWQQPGRSMQVTGAGDRVGAHLNQEVRLGLRGLHSPESASAEPSQQALGVRPHGHSVDVEPAADRDHAVTVLSGGSDRVHLGLGELCSRPSRWVQHHPRLAFRRSWLLYSDARFCLLPR